MDTLNRFHDWLATYPMAQSAVGVILLLIVAGIANHITRRILVRIVTKVMKATENQWDDAILARGVVHRIANIAPVLVIYFGIGLIPGLPPTIDALVRNVAMAYIVLTVALSLSGLLSAINDVYQHRPDARSRPIKGYLQLLKIAVFVITAIMIVAVLVERSPLLLLSGLGAMAAVLMLVFKDTILSLVASVQVQSNDMLRVGDWIEMPSFGADGDVIDIALHTVKVQNWDKTITTIPTYALTANSFKNWRGMSESGGRRIKRALNLDKTSIRFLDEEDITRLKRFSLLSDYLDGKRRELAEWNKALAETGREPVNTRRLTNAGTFRAYVFAYLRSNPKIHKEMTLLVRQLAPTTTGLPLEIYCFTGTTDWNAYEGIQGDIFDHLIAILPEFDLRLFQEPTGNDLRGALVKAAQEISPGAVADAVSSVEPTNKG
ncbi:MAG: mechanosensitive ion channel family protein [Rhodanobacteraceae bacterium]|nr:mechanosensitive ion channel family protein [Xanthomonadales bacterium]MCP5477407.1 mechanosensitive ion channel family protein [Rhodanobacteraceae bacterium]HPF73281.1 mechanosensitive ion channel family protein [Xanthomonadaceae bacterium]HRX99238.1 mechanosensitive ion channel family protein [Xanthomonadaceae bacterium]